MNILLCNCNMSVICISSSCKHTEHIEHILPFLIEVIEMDNHAVTSSKKILLFFDTDSGLGSFSLFRKNISMLSRVCVTPYGDG